MNDQTILRPPISRATIVRSWRWTTICPLFLFVSGCFTLGDAASPKEIIEVASTEAVLATIEGKTSVLLGKREWEDLLAILDAAILNEKMTMPTESWQQNAIYLSFEESVSYDDSLSAVFFGATKPIIAVDMRVYTVVGKEQEFARLSALISDVVAGKAVRTEQPDASKSETPSTDTRADNSRSNEAD